MNEVEEMAGERKGEGLLGGREHKGKVEGEVSV